MLIKLRLIISIFLLFIIITDLYAQTPPDSMEVRSIIKKSPSGAMLRSAILPGWGQAYNGKWFKSLLVMGTELGLAGNAMYLNKKVVRSQSEDERLFYQHHRNTFVWWFAGIYFLNILDAYVDAHLFQFDVSPDLSFGQTRNSDIGTPLIFSLNWRVNL